MENMNDEDIHEDGEVCNCSKCQAHWEEDMKFHLREYRLYCVKDGEGNLTDIRVKQPHNEDLENMYDYADYLRKIEKGE